MNTKFELAWLIGLLEGEGHFGIHKRTQVVSVRMTDEDTVKRAARAIKLITGNTHVVGSISQPVQPRQDVYYIQLYGSNARAVMKAVVKHMQKRRRIQIWKALNGYDPKKIRLPEEVLKNLLRNKK